MIRASAPGRLAFAGEAQLSVVRVEGILPEKLRQFGFKGERQHFMWSEAGVTCIAIPHIKQTRSSLS